MRRAFVVLCVLAALGAGGVALAKQSSASVKVTMKEWGIAPLPTKVPAGKVTFAVKNKGALKHEFIVLKTSTRASKLKTKGTVAVVIGLQGKIPQFAGGKTKFLTVTLKPGHYVLICNLPAHYKAGQHVDFTVG